MEQSRREFLGLATGVLPLTSVGRLRGVAAGLLGSSVMGTRALATEDDNPYLQLPYSPTTQEVEHSSLRVTGHLPEEIQGTYFRNGPNPVHETNPHHWFDGDGMVHRIRIENGRASYRNRFVNTWVHQKEKQWGAKVFPGLYEASTSTLATMAVNQLFDNNPVKDTSNTDVIYFNGQLISLWWLSGVPYALNGDTLEPIGVAKFKGYRGHVSAHARVDAATGELFFLDFSVLFPWVKVCCVAPDGTFKWSRKFDLPYPRIFHDVLFTEHYVVLLDLPVGYRPGVNAGIKLDMNSSSRIVLVPRDGQSAVKTFEAEPCYVLHGLNAFEVGKTVEITVNRFVAPFAAKSSSETGVPYVGALRVETRPYRWILDLQSGRWHEQGVFEDNTEFPRINDAMLGRPSRYSYHPRLAQSDTVEFNALIKYDWKRETRSVIELGNDRTAEEFVFIPRSNQGSNPGSEDDGWVASLVHDLKNHTQAFEIFDAKTFDPKPVASIEIPSRVPVGFHCKWVAASSY